MKSNYQIVRGPYLSDILDQPRALRATWNLLSESSVFDRIGKGCPADRFRRVVLTGMGSSYFGQIPLTMELARCGWTPIVLETSELIYSYPHLLTSSTLIIAVSQSGKSAEIVHLLELNDRKATVIAVTNQAESPLAQKSDFVVLTAAGDEFSVSCKTYVAAQMALATLAAALCAFDHSQRLHEFELIPDAVKQYLDNWQHHVEEFIDLLYETKDMFLVGRGTSLAAVGTGALIIKESAHFHAEGMSSAAFRHGPFEMLQRGVTVGVFTGSTDVRPLHLKLIDDISRTPARVLSFSVDAELWCCRLPETADAATPVVEALPIQMMTLALAALGNREAGRFDYASKVTIVE